MERDEKKQNLLTVAQAARLANVTENAIRYQIQIGTLTQFKNRTGKIRVSENEIINKLLKFE